MYFGADYYPEHWPESRWPQDIQLMKEAGINIVRLAEFAWSRIEKTSGVYDFSWLDQIIMMLSDNGIKVIMGTPTATPPKWLMDENPDIYMEDKDGLIKGFGSRRHYCYNSQTYRRHSARITEVMSRHFAGNENIAAWQIDNELTCGDGMYCYCESCRQGFIDWLQKKYQNLDNLNNTWGTVFWSQIYTDWSQIITPKRAAVENHGHLGHNPGLLLDYSRFMSDSVAGYCKIQADILRDNSDKPLLHNIIADHYDYFQLAEHIDIAAHDNYPQNPWIDFNSADPADQGASLDLHRGLKNKSFWVIEQQSGPCGWEVLGNTPKPGQIRLWTFQSLAHGAESILYFRWRVCLFGTEQYWYGILDHDGIPRRRYREIQKTAGEFQRLSGINSESRIISDVLMIRSFDQQWSHMHQRHNWDFNYLTFFQSYYKGFYHNHINVDINNEKADFDNYKLIVAPAFNLMSPDLQTKFETYVRNGGNLIITFRSGTRNWDNTMTQLTMPGYFSELAGIELEEFDSLNGGRTVGINGQAGTGQASIWADIIATKTAVSFARYTSEFYTGATAISENHYGEGKCWYIGCDLDQAAMRNLIRHISQKCGIEPVLPDMPDNVEAVRKISKDGEIFYFINNFNQHEIAVNLPFSARSLIDSGHNGSLLQLAAYGADVIKPD